MNKDEGIEVLTSEPEDPSRITIMQSGGKMTDIRFICQDQSFYAHKVIIAASSAYIRDIMFEQCSGTGDLFTIMMNSVKPVDVANILKYIYIGEARVRNSDSEGFLNAARILRVDKLLLNHRNVKKSIKKSASDLKAKESLNMTLSELKKEGKQIRIKGKGEKPPKLLPAVKKPRATKEGPATQFPKEVANSRYTKLNPIDNRERSAPLGLSSKCNTTALPIRVTSILQQSRPREPSPHPKIEKTNRYKVFVIPLGKKVQCTTLGQENKTDNESLGLSLTASAEFTFCVSQGGSSRFTSVVMTQTKNKIATSSATSNLKSIRSNFEQSTVAVGKNCYSKKHNGKVPSKNEIRRSSKPPPRLNKLADYEKIEKHKNKTVYIYEKARPHGKEGGYNFHERGERGGGSSKNGKPNPRVSESVCAPHATRTSRKSWFRHQLEQDVSDIQYDNAID